MLNWRGVTPGMYLLDRSSGFMNMYCSKENHGAFVEDCNHESVHLALPASRRGTLEPGVGGISAQSRPSGYSRDFKTWRERDQRGTGVPNRLASPSLGVA